MKFFYGWPFIKVDCAETEFATTISAKTRKVLRCFIMICLGLIFITNIVKFSFDMFLFSFNSYSFNFRITFAGFPTANELSGISFGHHRTSSNNTAFSIVIPAYNRIATNQPSSRLADERSMGVCGRHIAKNIRTNCNGCTI
jgi:hypothetical protein